MLFLLLAAAAAAAAAGQSQYCCPPRLAQCTTAEQLAVWLQLLKHASGDASARSPYDGIASLYFAMIPLSSLPDGCGVRPVKERNACVNIINIEVNVSISANRLVGILHFNPCRVEGTGPR